MAVRTSRPRQPHGAYGHRACPIGLLIAARVAPAPGRQLLCGGGLTGVAKVRLQVTYVAALAALAALVAGCGGPGAGIADRIRAANSPIVREVSFSPANPLEGSGEAIQIYLIDAASDAQALGLWCRVVLPAGAAQMPAGSAQLRKGGEPAVGGGSYGSSRVLANAVCPGDGSPSPSG
jgi:hypothetical protein